jgi:hypothetical protein
MNYRREKMLPELTELLKYRHEPVIKAYVRDRGGDEEKARDLFTSMLKFLWISEKHISDKKRNPSDTSLDFIFVMHEEMRDIDNMWHNFILYTRDYTAFCEKYFGKFLHHQPDIADQMVQTEGEFSEHMEKYLTYVYDNLGEGTVRHWFAAHL